MRKILWVVLGIFSAGNAIAGGANNGENHFFDGFYVQAEVGLASQNQETTQAYPGFVTNTVSFGQSNPQAALAVGYSHEIAKNWNLAGTISYNLTDGKSGNQNTSYGGSNSTIQFNTKNITTYTLEPGYYLSQHGLGYLKLGLATANSSMNGTNGFSTVNYGQQTGYLYGFGFKHGISAVHPNMYWGIETYQVQFQSKTVTDSNGVVWTSKPNMLFGKVHLGYMF